MNRYSILLGKDGVTEQSQIKLQDYRRERTCFSSSLCWKGMLRTFHRLPSNAQRLAYPENNFTVTGIQAMKGSGVQSLARVVSPDCAGDIFSDRAAT